MNRNRKFWTLATVSAFLMWISTAGILFAQWSPQMPSQPMPQQYPPPQQPAPASVPPQAQPQPYPPQGQMAQQAPQFQPGPGQALNDVFGRFSLSLPQGSMPMGSTYNFGIPQAMVQVSIMSVSQDPMFQMNMQNFPNMMKQMGATVDAEKPIDVGGRQGKFFGVTMKNPQNNTSVHAMNVFVPGPNLWVQVMGPEQNIQQIGQVLQSILGNLRF